MQLKSSVKNSHALDLMSRRIFVDTSTFSAVENMMAIEVAVIDA
jgi:hypothetical protein